MAAPKPDAYGVVHDPTPDYDPSSGPLPVWIHGRQEQTQGGTFPVTSPVDGALLYDASSCNDADVHAAVAAAAAVQPFWAASSANCRRDIFLRAADIFEDRFATWKAYAQRETGSNDTVTDLDFSLALQVLRNTAGLTQSVAGTVPPLATAQQSGFVLRQPFGVVLAIVPWNMPFVLGFRAVLGPLAAGNTVVLKGSERCPGVFWALGAILHEAGLPASCLNTVCVRPADAAAVTNALVAHREVRKVNFTGSTAIGAVVATLCGKYLKPVVLELGGKASTIVCDDANVESAAQGAAMGAFFHGGQICMSTERVIVHRSIAPAFIAALARATRDLFKGAPATLVAGVGVDKSRTLVSDALDKGAKTAFGDADARDVSAARMQPIALEGVDKSMDLYHTESFGPTVALFEFDDTDEALKLANDTDYGLSAAVFTEDLRRGLALARRIEAGAVHINSMTIQDESALPHGGIKNSGFGRFNGREGLDEWTYTKTITWIN